MAAAAAPSDRAYISELPAGCDEAQAKAVFGAYGNIKTCLFFPAKRACIIQFESVEEATWVVENLHGNIAQGLSTPVSVEFAGVQHTKGAAKGNWNAGGEKGSWGAAEETGGKQNQRWEPYGGKGAAGHGKQGGKPGGDEQQKGEWVPQQKGEAQKGSWSSQKGGAKDGSWEQQKGGWNQSGGEDGSWEQKGKGGKGKKGGVRVMKKGLTEGGALPGGKWSNDENALYVGGLPPDTTNLDLYEIFSPFGAIPYRGIRAMTREDGYTCKGFGFVNFLSSEPALKAIEALNGMELSDGSTLQVMTKAPAGPVNKGKGDDFKGKGDAKGKGQYGKQDWSYGK